MTTKQSTINKLYRICKPYLNGIHRDMAWEDLHKVLDTMRDFGYEVDIDNTQYNGMQNKTYYISIPDNKIRGHITCAFCGTVADPMECYDMSMVLY